MKRRENLRGSGDSVRHSMSTAANTFSSGSISSLAFAVSSIVLPARTSSGSSKSLRNCFSAALSVGWVRPRISEARERLGSRSSTPAMCASWYRFGRCCDMCGPRWQLRAGPARARAFRSGRRAGGSRCRPFPW